MLWGDRPTLPDLALGPLDEAPTNSTLGVRAEKGMGDPPSKPGMCDSKLSGACRRYNKSYVSDAQMSRLNLCCLTGSLAT
jgi:hypothetical protein